MTADEITEHDGHADAPDPPTDGTSLWAGDAGALRAPSRRALVQLLRGPYLSAARHPALWGALLNDEEPLRARLADMYLELVVDFDQQLAFVRNVDAEGIDAPRVVRTAPLTFMDTAMLLHLRQHLLTVGVGERAIVGLDEVQDHLAVYQPAGDGDHAGFAKRVNASWEKLKKYGLLSPTTTEERLEVSPVLRLVFGPDQIAAVRAEYARLASPAAAADDVTADDPGTGVDRGDQGGEP